MFGSGGCIDGNQWCNDGGTDLLGAAPTPSEARGTTYLGVGTSFRERVDYSTTPGRDRCVGVNDSRL